MRVVIALTALAVLALDWAAFHDILKGDEPGYAAEYTMLAASLVVFAGLWMLWRKLRHQA